MANEHHLHAHFFGGALLSKPDVRDRRFQVNRAARLPDYPIDNRALVAARTDQGATGSCGAHAGAQVRHAAINNWRQGTGQSLLDPWAERVSPLWTYWATRVQMGTFPQDSGSENRAIFQSMAQRGWVLDSDAPWNPGTAVEDIQRDLGDLDPPSEQYYRSYGYEYVGAPGASMPPSLCASLAEARVVMLAIGVWSNFWDNPDGHSPLPVRGAKLRGYHDVPVHSWEPDPGAPGGGWFLWRVSWRDFGDENGDARLSAAFVANAKWALEAERLV